MNDGMGQSRAHRAGRGASLCVFRPRNYRSAGLLGSRPHIRRHVDDDYAPRAFCIGRFETSFPRGLFDEILPITY